MTYFAGAAPCGCGKTTTAMVGTDFVGDDLAQMWIAEDGTCRAVNPEAGIFGIVEDVNREGDPFLMKALRDDDIEAIWSNVLDQRRQGALLERLWRGDAQEGHQLPGRVVRGQDQTPTATPIPPSHKNCRVTVDCQGHRQPQRRRPTPIRQGVPVKVDHLLRPRRRHHAAGVGGQEPDAGVAIGASIVSAATATEIGATGVKRQPWANAPFIPGALADYMNVQFKFFNSAKI